MSRIPRYHQIAQSLRERIDAGLLRPGERLDNQRRLAREFKVTLMTLRHALEILDRDGMITRRHGLGTFVASPSIDYDILHLRALAGDLSAKGENVATRFLRSYFARPDLRVARELQLANADRVFALERLRLVDGRPMSLQVSCVREGIGEELAKADLAVTPLRQLLAFKLGIDITAARETVSSVRLDARAARELGCRRGAPAFRADRVSLGANGVPVVYDRAFIPGDRFRITRELLYGNGRADGQQEEHEARPPGPSRSSEAHCISASPTKESLA